MNKQYPIRVAATADMAQDASASQVPPLYRVHAMMPGAAKTMCEQLAATEVTDIGLGQTVCCPDCRTELSADADKQFRKKLRADLDRADAELIIAMQMRANTLRNVLVGRNESLAAELEIVAGRLAEHTASSAVNVLLAGLNPDVYCDWISAGQRLKSAGIDNAFDAWVEWSKQSSKYVPSELQAKWAALAHFNRSEQTPSHNTSVPQAPNDVVSQDKDCPICGDTGLTFGCYCACDAGKKKRVPEQFVERRTRPRFIEVDLSALRRDLDDDARRQVEDIEQERLAIGGIGDDAVDDIM